MLSHVQEQMLTNLHFKLPFPVDYLIPASKKAGVCYVQHALALPSVEQDPTELTRGRTDCCGQSKNQHVHQTWCFRWLFSHFPCVCLWQPGRCSAFPWRVVQSSKYRGKIPGLCVAVDACLQQEGLLGQLFLASSEFLGRLYLLDLREETLGWKGWVVLMPDSQDDLLCVASRNHSCE